MKSLLFSSPDAEMAKEIEKIRAKTKEFEALAKPMVDWLRKNYCTAATAVITCDSAVVSTGEIGIPFNDQDWLDYEEPEEE